MKITLTLLFALISVTAIDQSCPCPFNSNCLNNQMCACNSGFIGNCSTFAPMLTSSPRTLQLTHKKVAYLQINPTKLDHYIQFTFNICPTTQTTLTITLYGQTGQNTQYNGDNQLGNSKTVTYDPNCNKLVTPYISFGIQPNGLDDLLVVGLVDSSSNSQISISVDQEAIIGVFLYEYILIAIAALIAIVIAIAVGVFIYRRRVRRGNSSLYAVSNSQEFNNIDHFQNFMPLFSAQQLGNDPPICPICLQQIEAAEVVRRTPCRHIFHSTCIDAWGMKNMSCPVCRMDLSLSSLTAAIRIRNSTIQMQLPPEDEEDWQYQIQLTTKSPDKSQKGQPPKGALSNSQKKQLKERML